MNIFHIIIRGIIQGLTEFLPVSSNGQLVIIEHIAGHENNSLFFNTMLHTGMLIALIVAYRKLIIRLFHAILTIISDIIMGRYRWSEMNEDENLLIMLIISFVPLFLLFVPLPFSGGLNATDIAQILMEKNAYFLITGISTTATGILLILGYLSSDMTDKLYKKRGIVRKKGAGRRYLNVIDSLSMGTAQLFAVIFPGLSRMVSVFVMGEMRGINKQKSLDYAFLTSIPAIVMATVLEGNHAIHSDTFRSDMLLPLTFGIVLSAVTGLFSITFLKRILTKNNIRFFVSYNIIIGTVVTAVGIIELNSGVNFFTGKYLVFI